MKEWRFYLLDKKDVIEDEIELIEIINFLWKKRRMILLMFLVILLFILLLYIFEQRQIFNAEGEEFSSLNIDRVGRGVYKLRARIFGQENSDFDRDIDFDRDFDIIITESGELLTEGLLSLTIESQAPNIEVIQMIIHGRLRNRDSDDFHVISLNLQYLNLKYGMRSREFPIAIYTTNEHHEIQPNNMDLLVDIAEFREYFGLDFLEIEYYDLSLNDERLGYPRLLRYTASQDLYELFVQEDETQNDLTEPEVIEQELIDNEEQEQEIDPNEQQQELADNEQQE